MKTEPTKNLTYVDNMSNGNVNIELTEPVNRQRYIRPEN